MTTIPGKLKVGLDGRVSGPADITYNSPFPCVNGRYGSGAMNGVVMHTMVGNLPQANAWFNNPAAQASAHFGIDQEGRIHQWGPIGKGWIAWAEAAGNDAWYSIEHADNGNPDNPLTDAQILASAQLLECLSAFAGFPLQEANTPAERGYGVHYMGGAAWGGHTCPDLPPNHVRSRQRPAIIELAKLIRAGHIAPAPVPAPPPSNKSGTGYRWVADGSKSLQAVAEARGAEVIGLIQVSAENMNAKNREAMNAYLVGIGVTGNMPAGLIYYTVNA